jgi:hypothetical protein
MIQAAIPPDMEIISRRALNWCAPGQEHPAHRDALQTRLRSCKVAATNLGMPIRWRLGGGFVGDFLGGIIDKGRPAWSHHFQVGLTGPDEVGTFVRHCARALVVGSEVIDSGKSRILQESSRPTTS